MTTAELAHEACGYAAHNKVCPLAIAQALRAQVERDAERDAESMDSVWKLLVIIIARDQTIAHANRN